MTLNIFKIFDCWVAYSSFFPYQTLWQYTDGDPLTRVRFWPHDAVHRAAHAVPEWDGRVGMCMQV